MGGQGSPFEVDQGCSRRWPQLRRVCAEAGFTMSRWEHGRAAACPYAQGSSDASTLVSSERSAEE